MTFENNEKKNNSKLLFVFGWSILQCIRVQSHIVVTVIIVKL